MLISLMQTVLLNIGGIFVLKSLGITSVAAYFACGFFAGIPLALYITKGE